MSMREFERQLNEWEDHNPSRLSQQGMDLPDDFSMEDMAFAQELETLFVPDKEEIPPYFAQTLLEPDDPRFQPVEHKFEQKTAARVFRRLKLRRRLFRRTRPSLRSFVDPFPIKRQFIGLVASCLCFMVLTMVATSCSFASGLNILLAGTHSGVVQVPGYPILGKVNASIAHPKSKVIDPPEPKQIGLYEAQQAMHFPMYWPTTVPNNYTLGDIYMHADVGGTWADGPILELNYEYNARGAPTHGTGLIAICEFKPIGNVYQAIQTGAAHQILVNKDDHNYAIYVDGQWVRINKFSHNWIYGARSEIIYEKNGIVFWIVGDQRDGIDQNELLNIASSLQVFDFNRAMHVSEHIANVTIPLDDSAWIFADDVIYTENVAGSTWTTVGNPNSTTNTNTKTASTSQQKGGTRSH